MSALLSDPYLPYVAIAYAVTAGVIGLLVAASLRANTRARQALEDAESEARKDG
ncbi:MAG: heme exporter protein CcmD [Pseudomonadota bacterium]